MSDKQMFCVACGGEFLFTEEEQQFFAEKGFQEPKKCKPCRQAAKQQRGGGYGGGGGYGRAPRQLFDTVCSACGVQTQVPFQPNGSKPVYCRDCYKAQQTAAY
ncbi:MAG: CxxC-x17-CxxC domain-containing protein [Vampirovibrionales bacterium]|nr:CxxC-x17-CxxC domain-containing protein [Vampirovibrionales bacterium]